MRRPFSIAAALLAAALVDAGVAERLHAQQLTGIVMTGAPAPAPPERILLDVPFVAQERLLCGAAAVEMALRHAGAHGFYARDFATLVREDEGGIRTDELAAAVTALGWQVRAGPSDRRALQADLAAGRPPAVLLSEKPGRYHYVLVVGVTADSVIVHDPDRRPRVGVPKEEFERRWSAAGRWSLVLLSDAATAGAALASLADGEPQTAAAAGSTPLPPPHPQLERASALFRASRWHEAAATAREAADADPTDRRASALLATSLYLAGDQRGALRAWSRDHSLTLDGVAFSGLRRTRHSVARELLGLHPGEPLEAGALERARRRLSLLPTSESSALTYRALPGGIAVAEATITERVFPPRGVGAAAALLLPALATSELRARIAGLTEGGEAATVFMRWAAARPGIGFTIAAPGGRPLASVVELRAAWERERHALEYPGVTTVETHTAVETRATVRLGLTDWATGWLRWRLEGGVDRWGEGAHGVVGRIELEASLVERGASLIGAVEHAVAGDDAPRYLRWTVEGRAEPLAVGSAWRLGVRALAAGVGAEAPRMLHPGAGVGRARDGLLRAHPIDRGGTLSARTIGNGMLNGSLELERRVASLALARLGIAAFMDAARISSVPPLGGPVTVRRLVDYGLGLRIALPAGRLRLEGARGNDHSRALSIGWESTPAGRHK